MCARARRFFARLNRLEFSSPLVEASSGNPEFLGKIIDAFAGLHPLYGCALKLPGISLPSLHWCSSPGECAHRDCANSRGHSIACFSPIMQMHRQVHGQKKQDFTPGKTEELRQYPWGYG